MKKITLCLSTLFVIFFQTITAQTFNGIAVGNPTSQTHSELIKKGFVLTETIGNIKAYKGKIPSGENVEIKIVETKKSQIVWKFMIYFDSEYSWENLKDNYAKYKNILTSKYGTPKSDYAFFKKPYYEGDGFELQALYLDKVSFASFYSEGENHISQRLISYRKGEGQVLLSYENAKASLLDDNEKESINKETF